MNNEPRVWKWLVPAAVMCAMPVLAIWVSEIAERNAWPSLVFCNIFFIGLMPVLAIQAWAAFGAYYRHQANEDYIEMRNADATTAETRLFEFARAMHPETVKLLLMHRKTKWRIKEARLGDLVDWVLDADPRVHVQFVEYMLKNSTAYAMMPINRLSDGVYSFDADKLITDRDQYMAFHRILVNRLMATEAHGNMPGQWIEPWTNELVARQFGVVLEDEFVEVPVAVEGQRDKGAEVQAKAQPVRVEASPLTDEEAQRIGELEHARATMSTREYMEFCKNKKGETA